MSAMDDKWAVVARNAMFDTPTITVGPFNSYEEAWQWAIAKWPNEDNVKWRVTGLTSPDRY